MKTSSQRLQSCVSTHVLRSAYGFFRTSWITCKHQNLTSSLSDVLKRSTTPLQLPAAPRLSSWQYSTARSFDARAKVSDPCDVRSAPRDSEGLPSSSHLVDHLLLAVRERRRAGRDENGRFHVVHAPPSHRPISDEAAHRPSAIEIRAMISNDGNGGCWEEEKGKRIGFDRKGVPFREGRRGPFRSGAVAVPSFARASKRASNGSASKRHLRTLASLLCLALSSSVPTFRSFREDPRRLSPPPILGTSCCLRDASPLACASFVRPRRLFRAGSDVRPFERILPRLSQGYPTP